MANYISSTTNHKGEECPNFGVIHVEVLLKTHCNANYEDIKLRIKKYLSNFDIMLYDNLVKFEQINDKFLNENIISISIDSNENNGLDKLVKLSEKSTKVHLYYLNDENPDEYNVLKQENEEMNVTSACMDTNVNSYRNWLLPSKEFHKLWESLIYQDNIKSNLLDYINTTLLFAEHNVDSKIIHWNKVILLHGPPGTGKTSLCKALSQKIMIRLSDKYSYGYLIEINSHSLFSKYFSESGKLVQKMFQKICEWLSDPKSLIIVLIDEVESLAAARSSSLSGSEPSDSIRVVNAILTQLDNIKRYPNILILTTSNITGALDLAFIDRADLKIYIGLPTSQAIFQIFRSCMIELMQAGIIKPKLTLVDLKCLEVMRFQEQAATIHSLKLYQIARLSQGLSGRTVRKIPFLAHAFYIKKNSCIMEEFLEGLDKMVKNKLKENNL